MPFGGSSPTASFASASPSSPGSRRAVRPCSCPSPCPCAPLCRSRGVALPGRPAPLHSATPRMRWSPRCRPRQAALPGRREFETAAGAPGLLRALSVRHDKALPAPSAAAPLFLRGRETGGNVRDHTQGCLRGEDRRRKYLYHRPRHRIRWVHLHRGDRGGCQHVHDDALARLRSCEARNELHRCWLLHLRAGEAFEPRKWPSDKHVQPRILGLRTGPHDCGR